jgi:hypothetical protein
MLLRLLEDRPASQLTGTSWPRRQFVAEGKKVFVLVWDNARWRLDARVQRRIGGHNPQGQAPARRL